MKRFVLPILLSSFIAAPSYSAAMKLNYMMPLWRAEAIKLSGEIIKVAVILTFKEYDLDMCSGSNQPHGFYIGIRDDSRELMLGCGAPKPGTVIKLLNRKPI